MYVPDLNNEHFEEPTSDDPYGNETLDGKADDVIQELYRNTRSEVEEKLGVEINVPHPNVISFRYGDRAVDLQYVETGEERFLLLDRDAVNEEVSEEEFVEETDEEVLRRLQKAIEIYGCVVDAQQKTVHGRVLEARYT